MKRVMIPPQVVLRDDCPWSRQSLDSEKMLILDKNPIELINKSDLVL